MSTAYWLTGDVREVMVGMPDNSVDLILTSPPFLALRSYLPADHPDKGKEIGSEPTPADFLDTLLDLTVEWRRVLAPHGSLVVELGDTYAGSGGAGGDYADGGMREGQPTFKAGHPPFRAGYLRADGRKTAQQEDLGHDAVISSHGGGRGWPLDKSLCMIPELYRLSLAYGRNILRPERVIEPWRVRNVIRWCRSNPPVGALGDKFRPATSDMVVACTSRTRWFDLDAVRTEYGERFQRGMERGENRGAMPGAEVGAKQGERVQMAQLPKGMSSDHAGAPPLDWWQVSTEPYAGSHYATWPRALLTRPIKAMCPTKVCRTCGEPSRRIVGDAEYIGSEKDGARADGIISRGGHSVAGTTTGSNAGLTRVAPTLGWTDCGHNDWRNGVVLDPFAGSGTTLAVASGHGRDSIGIDLDARNLELARERVGMWLVEGPPPEWAAAGSAA